jgi:hypothetical protein
MAHKGWAAAWIFSIVLSVAAPGYSQDSMFGSNEARAAAMKDHFREMRTTLQTESAANRLLTIQTKDAFRNTADWAPAAEAYYALRRALLARSNVLEAKLDAVMASNTSEKADAVNSAIEPLYKKADVLRTDYEFYVRLPVLAAGPQREAAQASMRLLSQTEEYPIAFAYFLSKTSLPKPFSPMPAALMPFHHF